MSAKVCPVVMVVAMALATPATWVIPETPVLQESHEAQLVTFCRSWGHSTHQGVEETLHLEPEF